MKIRSHAPSMCEGTFCPLHNPSDHHMNTWPVTVRYDRYCMTERLCEHGCGHPDPDSMEWLERVGLLEAAGGWTHGCCGCCAVPEE